MNTLHCRPILPSDLAQVLDLDQRCFQGFWSQTAYQREIESPNSDLLGLIVHTPPQTDQVIGLGCAWTILDEAHITLLAIAPEYQRQGLGQWLLMHLMQAACDRHLTHATLEVRKSNQRAISLYTKFDFQVAGTRPKYYADNEDALILWRSGLQDPAFAASLTQAVNHQWTYLQRQGWDVISPSPRPLTLDNSR